MKRLIIKLFIFFSLGFLLLNFVISPLYIKNYRLVHHHGKWAIQAAVLQKCKKQVTTDYIILGDSATNQVYNIHRNPASFACNAGTHVVGQYILAMELYKRNPHIKAILLMPSPFIISFPFARKSTYRQFLIPFLSSKHQKYFTSTIRKYIPKNIKIYLAFLPYFKITNLISDLQFAPSPTDPKIKGFIKPYAMEYYKKFKEFSRKTGVMVKVIPLPVRLSKRTHWRQALIKIRQQVKEENLEDVFSHLWKSPQYSKDSHYRDRFHFNWPNFRIYKKIYDAILTKELAKLGIKLYKK